MRQGSGNPFTPTSHRRTLSGGQGRPARACMMQIPNSPGLGLMDIWAHRNYRAQCRGLHGLLLSLPSLRGLHTAACNAYPQPATTSVVTHTHTFPASPAGASSHRRSASGGSADLGSLPTSPSRAEGQERGIVAGACAAGGGVWCRPAGRWPVGNIGCARQCVLGPRDGQARGRSALQVL